MKCGDAVLGDAEGAGARPARGTEPAGTQPDRLPEWRPAGDRSPSRFARAGRQHAVTTGPATRRGPGLTDGEREHRRRFLAKLGATLVVLAVTSQAVVLVDDLVGDALDVRYAMPAARLQDLSGRNITELSIATTPGDQMYVTVPTRSRSVVGCQIRDGDEWTALPRLETGRNWVARLTGDRPRRRGGFRGRMSTSRIHEFLVVEDVTTLRCDASQVRTGIEVWRDDGRRQTAYQVGTWSVRGLWLAAGTALLWGPLLAGRHRRRRARAAGD